MSLPDELRQTFASDFSPFAPGGSGRGQWTTSLPHGVRSYPGTSELQYYADPSNPTDPFGVSGGVLDITASPGGNTAGEPYTSGVITTQGSFAQLYGYFDITAELPAGVGSWPAFWLLPQHQTGSQELDVMEEYGRNPYVYDVTLHSPSSGIAGAPVATPDLAAGFHDYGVYWTPTTISFYLDGALVAAAPTPADMNTPMIMLADLAVGGPVPPSTTFPLTLKIAGIRAFAYDPAVAGPPAPLVTHVPATLSATLGESAPVPGFSVTDPAAGASDVITATVADKSLGTLSLTAQGGANVLITNGFQAEVTGTLSQVNATLATLSYKNVPTSAGAAAATSDQISLSATDPHGDFDSTRTAVAIGAGGPLMSFLSIGPGPERVAAQPNEVFALSAGAIADPRANRGQADDIVNFRSAADHATGGDFLALHGFGTTASLVFDHYGDVGGAPDLAMQWYRVAGASGSSPIFLVQMAGGATTHLAPADYGFYPT